MDKQKKLKAVPMDLRTKVWRDECVKASGIKEQ